jgi:GT2 family glycosyltransferase
MKVTAEISTRNRYDTTLPVCITAIANQTFKPKELLIYDDGDQKDLRNIPIYQNLFELLKQKGIAWKVIFGEKRGQVRNHQKAIKDACGEWIWRVDDDTIPESDTLKQLVDNIAPGVGAIAGLVLDPKIHSNLAHIASNKIEDIYFGMNKQWYKHEGNPYEVDHLYCSFLFRKEAAAHGYCMELSPAGHREETIFTYEMKRAGWKLLLDPDIITWHLRETTGGIRDHHAFFFEHDERIFHRKLKEWNITPNKRPIIVLDNGLGDHFVFKRVLPLFKYKPVIACCYKEVFEDMDVQLISIADARSLFDIDKVNTYRWMAERNWTKSLEEAYKEQYGLNKSI